MTNTKAVPVALTRLHKALLAGVLVLALPTAAWARNELVPAGHSRDSRDPFRGVVRFLAPQSHGDAHYTHRSTVSFRTHSRRNDLTRLAHGTSLRAWHARPVYTASYSAARPWGGGGYVRAPNFRASWQYAYPRYYYPVVVYPSYAYPRYGYVHYYVYPYGYRGN
jgi:hypothetical protein